MSKKIFIILGVVSFLVTILSSVMLFVREANSMDLVGYIRRDCVPYNVFVEKGEKEYSAKISWITKAECVGFVLYGNSSNSLDLVAVDLTNKAKSKTHEVVLENILSSERYYFLINSGEKSYGSSGSPVIFSSDYF